MVLAILLSYLSLESFKLLFYHPLAAPLNAEPQDAREKSAIFILIELILNKPPNTQFSLWLL